MDSPAPERELPEAIRRRAETGATLVLCYHAVSESWPEQFTVTPAQLRCHLEYFLGRGYRAVTFTEALSDAGSDRIVAITFDDAYRSIFARALPVLEELGIPGTVFVPTAFPGSGRLLKWPGIDHWVGTPHEQELVPFDWDEAKQLSQAGWEIGSHTVTHPHLTSLSDEDLEHEMVESRRQLERRLGRPCTSIAYPYGDWDDRTLVAARRAGYRFAASTLFEQWGDVRSHNWPRVAITAGDTEWVLRKKTDPRLLRLRGTRAWPALVGAWRRLRYRDRT